MVLTVKWIACPVFFCMQSNAFEVERSFTIPTWYVKLLIFYLQSKKKRIKFSQVSFSKTVTHGENRMCLSWLLENFYFLVMALPLPGKKPIPIFPHHMIGTFTSTLIYITFENLWLVYLFPICHGLFLVNGIGKEINYSGSYKCNMHFSIKILDCLKHINLYFY